MGESKENTGSNVFTTFVLKTFESFKDQTWFKILCALILLVFFGVMMYNISNYSVKKTIEVQNEKEKVEHQANFEKSMHVYSDVKRVIRQYQNVTNADYIFLLEYHNGSENIITGVQFCKFDITLEVIGDSVQWVNTVKFKDDIIARYDVLTNCNLTEKVILMYNMEELAQVDRYLYCMMESLGAKEVAITNLSNSQRSSYGAILFISINEPLERYYISRCKNEVEKSFLEVK